MKKIIFICLPLMIILNSCLMGAKFKTTFDENSKTSFYVPTLVDYSAYLYISRDLMTNECNMRMKVKDIQDTEEEVLNFYSVKIGTSKHFLEFETFPGEHVKKIDRVKYQFEKNKGYGTKVHIEALKEYGPTKIHRKTFIGNFVDITYKYEDVK